MPYIKINKANLYFEEEGKGEVPIVFGHSMLFNLRMFDDQVNFLKSDFKCIRFDFRGQGKSEVTKAGYALDELANDTVKLIKALKCGPCHFVGFSMGGMVALRLAVKYPELIKSLILIDTSSEPQDDMLRNRILIWIAKYFGIGILANKVMSMFFAPKFLKDKNKVQLRNTWKQHYLANDQAGILRVIKAVVFRKSITPTLDTINQPAIIMVGEKDILTDYNKAKILHQHIKHSELKIIPNAGHMSTVEEPDVVNQFICEFLNNLADNKYPPGNIIQT